MYTRETVQQEFIVVNKSRLFEFVVTKLPTLIVTR